MRHRLRRLIRRDTSDGGYTLTEMLVVIGIIGVIAAALTPGIIGQFARAKSKAAQLQLDTLVADIEAFSSDVQRYPTQAEGLQVLVQQPASLEGWSGPYVRDPKALNDPWGHPIIYAIQGDQRTFTVTSLGADGRIGGTGVDRDLVAPAARQRLPASSAAPASSASP